MIRLRATFVTLAATALGGSLLTGPVSVALVPDSAARPAASPTASSDQDAARRPVYCKGRRATIVRGRANNRIFGTNRRDVIVAGRGNDVVLGRGGRDVICGGRGNDVLDGGPRLDRLFGQRHRDFCSGERREHRRHKGCEVHRPSIRVRPPRQEPRVGATPVSRAEARRIGNEWFDHQHPYCSFGNINFGNVYLRGDYTNPGYVYVAAGTSVFDFAAGTWLAGNGFHPGWYQVPTDGQLYERNFGAYNVAAGQVWDASYGVWWWNGAEWVDLVIYTVDAYLNDDEAGGAVWADICLT